MQACGYWLRIDRAAIAKMHLEHIRIGALASFVESTN
jgi:hypothetical protein